MNAGRSFQDKSVGGKTEVPGFIGMPVVQTVFVHHLVLRTFGRPEEGCGRASRYWVAI